MRHLTDSELAGFLDQELSSEERRRVEEHLDACDACRAEAIGAARLLAVDWDREAPGTTDENAGQDVDPIADPAAGRSAGPIAGPIAGPTSGRSAGRGGRRGWRLPAGIAGLAAAAALAALLFVRPAVLPDQDPPDRERFITEGLDRLVIYAPPADSEVAREDLRFVWADRGTESYRITVTAEDGGLVWSEALADTSVVPPATVELRPGQRFFWYVDAISAGVVARTGAHTFRIAP